MQPVKAALDWRHERMAVLPDAPFLTPVATLSDDERVGAEPFDAIELDLALLWADVEPMARRRIGSPASGTDRCHWKTGRRRSTRSTSKCRWTGKIPSPVGNSFRRDNP